jgi:hypothetical protein
MEWNHSPLLDAPCCCCSTDLGHLPALGLVNFQRKHWLGVMYHVSTFCCCCDYDFVTMPSLSAYNFILLSQIDARRFPGWVEEMKSPCLEAFSTGSELKAQIKPFMG